MIYKRLLFSTLLTLFLLELVLQVGALFVWASNRQPAGVELREGQKNVLCIGDSFTFGQGSSARELAYPAQLEGMLRRDLGAEWKVINGGYPGRNSRDLLERIRGQLEKYTPEFVYIIVGINDQWTKPDLLHVDGAPDSADLSPGGDSFRVELRTWRMVKWMSGGLLSEDPVAPVASAPEASEQDNPIIPPELIGSWMRPGLSIHIRPDGELQAGKLTLRCLARDETLRIRSTQDFSSDLHWSVEENVLLLRAPGSAAALRFQRPSRRPGELYELGKSAELSGKLEQAVMHYEQAIKAAAADANPFWLVALIKGLILLERRVDAVEVIGELRSRYEKEATADLAAAICTGLSHMGNREEGVAEARRALERYPDNPYLLQVFAWESYQGGERVRSIPNMERAVSLADGTNPAMRRYTRYLLARMLAEDDPEKAIRVIADLSQLEDAEEQVLTVVHNVKKHVGLELVETTLPKTQLDAEEQADLLAIFRSSYEPKTDVFATVEAHLEQIINLADQNGAVVVLSSYPWHNQEISQVHSRLVQRTRARRLDMAPDFQAALRDAERSDLFVEDGHCNDRGYGIMAQAVFRDLRSRLLR